MLMLRIKEIYDYRQMLKSLVLGNLRTRYKGSVLGFLWTFLNPLLLLGVYTVMFSTIMRIDMDNYVMYLFVGLLAWTMFQSSLNDSVAVINNNANLIKKIYFPREILPIAQVLAGVLNYCFSFIILIIALLIFNVKISSSILYLPLVLLTQTILTTGLSFVVSSLNVYFRDLQHMLSIFLMAWFYFTPILYVSSMIPDQYRFLFNLNPMAPIIKAHQDILFYSKAPNLFSLIDISIVSIIILFLGWSLFLFLNKGFAEEV